MREAESACEQPKEAPKPRDLTSSSGLLHAATHSTGYTPDSLNHVLSQPRTASHHEFLQRTPHTPYEINMAERIVCDFGDAETLPGGNVFHPQVLQNVDATDDNESTGQLNMDFFAAAPVASSAPLQVDPIAPALVSAPAPMPPTTQEPIFDFSGA